MPEYLELAFGLLQNYLNAFNLLSKCLANLQILLISTVDTTISREGKKLLSTLVMCLGAMEQKPKLVNKLHDPQLRGTHVLE